LWAELNADQGRYLRYVRQTKRNQARMRSHLKALIARGQVLVVEASDAVVGFSAVVADLPRMDVYFASATISDLYVSKAGRAQGCGRALLTATVAMIQARGLHAVRLSVSAGNEQALGLYRALGFKPEKQTLLLPLDSSKVRFDER
jgi:ribosomal protein S18 acetylase RimI-like enzyme